MTVKERASCINTIKLLQRLALNVHGMMDVIDAENCDKIIKMLEADAPQWIPCSERLPEVGKDVMVCYDFKGHRSVLIGVLYDDEKFHGYEDEYLTPEGRKYRKAVAWMPLPEPYREERTEE